MNLHQFRFVREAVRQNFNLTEAAKALYTSQPGVSKAIIELEDELGVEIFTRHGKRVRSLTEPGRIILASVERILQEVESLKRIGKDYAAQDQGNLVIAATHTQARYSLPAAIAEFKKRYPKVHLSILQGSPSQVAEMVIHDQADVAIATEGLSNYKELVTLPCFTWHHVAVMQDDHPLLERKQLSLDERDRHLRAMPVGHLFGSNITRVGLKQGAYLRSYVYTLVELLSPSMNRKLIEQALKGESETYEL
jgi:LysR family cys regulon transcriptional activator